ncbi:MAG: phospho-sugar mutase [Bacteroidales bacterium]
MIDPKIIDKAKQWLDVGFDEETRKQVRDLMENDPAELTESFYRDLEFGTGGLRGIMGVGTNRMNKYTVGMATQGLANYLKKEFSHLKQISVAIAHDSRNRSREFARITAGVFSANRIKVYLFDDLRPTPELSFAIRHYKCQSGVVITASHNPKEYNGYKAYWEDGGQLIPPHDKNVMAEVGKITSIGDVAFDGDDSLIRDIGRETDELYLKEIHSLSLSRDIITRHSESRIVYTPLHGTGARLIPECLRKFGFTNVFLVEEQAVPDGNFPTVKSPNPEEHAALEMSLALADKINANLVMATDPDADRVGIAVRNPGNELVLLDGNQTGALLIHYLLTKWKENNKLTGNEYIVKTIVTSEILTEMARAFDVGIYDVLTGFKWIADIIRKNEGKKTFIAGGEESYGYMIGDFVRDKDAVSACALIAEASAWAAGQNKTLYDILLDIYHKYGYYQEKLISVVKKGRSGSEEIAKLMGGYRESPPSVINNSNVVRIKDYQNSKDKDLVKGATRPIDLPASNVLQFFLEDGSKISVRPSGTEPKIKYYFSVNAELKDKKDAGKVKNALSDRIASIIRDLDLN